MSAHDGKTVRCSGELTNDDGEPLTVEEPLPSDHPEAPGVTQVPQQCGRQLSFQAHGRYERALKGDRRDRFESGALVFTCPDCGGETAICPVCSDPADRSPAGWIDGSDGEQIPCHNCNQQEIAERRRRGMVR